MFIVSIVLVTVLCVLSRALIVPVTQSCRDEINSRTFLMKKAKRDFILTLVFNRQQKATIKRNQMSGGKGPEQPGAQTDMEQGGGEATKKDNVYVPNKKSGSEKSRTLKYLDLQGKHKKKKKKDKK